MVDSLHLLQQSPGEIGVAQMQHLVYPDHPAIPRLAIPFVCKGCKEYDGLGYYDYPQRRGCASRKEALETARLWCSGTGTTCSGRVNFGTFSEFVGQVVLGSVCEWQYLTRVLLLAVEKVGKVV